MLYTVCTVTVSVQYCTVQLLSDGVADNACWKNRLGMAQELRMVASKYETLALDSD